MDKDSSVALCIGVYFSLIVDWSCLDTGEEKKSERYWCQHLSRVEEPLLMRNSWVLIPLSLLAASLLKLIAAISGTVCALV